MKVGDKVQTSICRCPNIYKSQPRVNDKSLKVPARVVSVRYERKHCSGEEIRILPALLDLKRKDLRGEYRIIHKLILTIALGNLVPCGKV